MLLLAIKRSDSARRILTQLNRGEGRHGLARDVCHGHRGELRQRYRQGQEEQLGALGLILNTIVRYNTIYSQRALDPLNATGVETADTDIERISPLGTDHITLTGRCRIAPPERLPTPHRDGRRPSRLIKLRRLSRFSHELSIAPVIARRRSATRPRQPPAAAA